MGPILRMAGRVLLAMTLAGAAVAEPGQPVPWGLGLQAGVTPVKHSMATFHDVLLLPVIVAITLLVLGLLLYCMIKFNAKANPTPTRTTHNTLIEVLWTGLPVIILLVIAVPSFKLLDYGDRAPGADMTIKAIGKQWYWTYEYPDHGDLSFDAIMVPDDELQPGQPRLLTTDTAVVVPVETNVRLLATAADVIHSWAIPSFGVKVDAIPGRINESWFRVEMPGTYYGQCSELCGTNHAFMPIMVKAVPKEEFEAWTQQMAAAGGVAPVRVADAQPAQ